MKFRGFFAILVVSLGSSTFAPAQPGNPGGDPDVPITGIEVLIGLGGALGLKKMMSKKKNNL
jgi:hypothetical protein